VVCAEFRFRQGDLISEIQVQYVGDVNSLIECGIDDRVSRLSCRGVRSTSVMDLLLTILPNGSFAFLFSCRTPIRYFDFVYGDRERPFSALGVSVVEDCCVACVCE
jgi:hypothetical protein